ncbi:hypothetical protein CIB84_000129, partial [Bambusicola thoracicus]
TKEGGAWIIHSLFNRCFLKFAEVLHESLPTVASNTDVTPIAHLYAAGSTMGSYWSAHELKHIFLYPVSQADCYVSLSLPTASSETVRTRTIKNCKDPVWNETFCFRIQSQVKNILELKVYDENTITKDDLLFTVLFDVAKIQLGETVRLTFQLNPEVRNKKVLPTGRKHTFCYYLLV